MLVDAEREGRGYVLDTIGALRLRLGEGGAEGFLIACTRARAGLWALPRGGIAPLVWRALATPYGATAALLVEECGEHVFALHTPAPELALNAGGGEHTTSGL